VPHPKLCLGGKAQVLNRFESEPESRWLLSGQRSSISRPTAGRRGFPIRSDCEMRGVSWNSRRRRLDVRLPNHFRGHWEEDAETPAHEITSRGSVRRQSLFEEESQVVHTRVSSSSRRSPIFRDFWPMLPATERSSQYNFGVAFARTSSRVRCKCPVRGHFPAKTRHVTAGKKDGKGSSHRLTCAGDFRCYDAGACAAHQAGLASGLAVRCSPLRGYPRET